jgi:hypothetical protein
VVKLSILQSTVEGAISRFIGADTPAQRLQAFNGKKLLNSSTLSLGVCLSEDGDLYKTYQELKADADVAEKMSPEMKDKLYDHVHDLTKLMPVDVRPFVDALCAAAEEEVKAEVKAEAEQAAQAAAALENKRLMAEVMTESEPPVKQRRKKKEPAVIQKPMSESEMADYWKKRVLENQQAAVAKAAQAEEAVKAEQAEQAEQAARAAEAQADVKAAEVKEVFEEVPEVAKVAVEAQAARVAAEGYLRVGCGSFLAASVSFSLLSYVAHGAAVKAVFGGSALAAVGVTGGAAILAAAVLVLVIAVSLHVMAHQSDVKQKNSGLDGMLNSQSCGPTGP